MKYTITLLALLLAAALSPARLSAQVVKMGLILPLSGVYSQTAQAMRQAAELAVEQLPPELKSRVELSFEDDQLNGMLAVSAFDKLVSAKNISAVLTFGGQSVAALAPPAGARRIPAFALTADSALVRGKTFVYQHWLTSHEQAAAFDQALNQELAGLKKAALVATTHNAALDIKGKFAEALKRHGVAPVYDNEFLPAETDFRTAVTQIKKTSPDLILTVLLAPQMGLFARQAGQAGITQRFFSSANAEVLSEVLSAQGAMEGLLYAGPDLDRAFVQEFEARYGNYPEFAAPHVYDCVRLFAAAVAQGAANAEQINSALLNVRGFKGAMGTYSLEEGFRFGVKAVVKQVKEGRFVKAHSPG